MKKGRLYSGLGLMLLLLGLVVMLVPGRRPDDLTISAADHRAQRPRPMKPAPDDIRREESKRTDRDRTWRHAKEIPWGESPELAESPVFLGFLQADPSNTKLRIGLRQENGGKIDTAALTVSVNLRDAGGRGFESGDKVSTEWQTKNGSFEDSAAPVLMVDSEEAIGEVDVALSYKGQEIERRKYTLEGR